MKRLPEVLMILLTMTFAIGLSWYTVATYHTLNLFRFDLGNIEQLVWYLVHGHGFVMTDPYGTATVSRLAFHVDPLLALLAIPYAIVPSATTLIVAQVVAVASGIVAAFLLGRKILGLAWAGFVASLMYALAVPVLWSTIFPIHAVTFAMPLILWMVWAALRKNRFLMVVCAALILLSKEQAGFSLGLFGLWYWWHERDHRLGPIMTVVPLVWSLIAMLIILPHFQQQITSGHDIYTTPLGSSATQIVKSSLQHPATFVRTIVTRQNAIMAGELLVGTGGLALGSPLSLAALPDFVINSLSAKPQQHELTFQYNDTLWPWLLIGALFAGASLAKYVRGLEPKIIHITGALWCLIGTLVAAYAFGPLPGTPNSRIRFATWRNEYAASIETWVGKIPATAIVSTTNNVGAHFATRQHLYTFPIVSNAEYVVALVKHGATGFSTEKEIDAKVMAMKSNQDWSVVYSQKDLTIFHRK